MNLIYANPCCNEVCYKETALCLLECYFCCLFGRFDHSWRCARFFSTNSTQSVSKDGLFVDVDFRIGATKCTEKVKKI